MYVGADPGGGAEPGKIHLHPTPQILHIIEPFERDFVVESLSRMFVFSELKSPQGGPRQQNPLSSSVCLWFAFLLCFC